MFKDEKRTFKVDGQKPNFMQSLRTKTILYPKSYIVTK